MYILYDQFDTFQDEERALTLMSGEYIKQLQSNFTNRTNNTIIQRNRVAADFKVDLLPAIIN